MSFSVPLIKIPVSFTPCIMPAEIFCKISLEDKTTLGMTNGTCDVWIIQTADKYKENKYHRKNTGLNHIAFGVYSKEDVDTFVKEFLEPKNIKPLYNSPKEFKEYQDGYYAVYFEGPDRIKLEVVYIPKFGK